MPNIKEIKQAIRILDPETTRDALIEAEYYGGFDQEARLDAVNKACEVACEVMREYLRRANADGRH